MQINLRGVPLSSSLLLFSSPVHLCSLVRHVELQRGYIVVSVPGIGVELLPVTGVREGNSRESLLE